MPASFAADLCGYRKKNGNPNTSDNTADQSKYLGKSLFEAVGVPDGQEVGDDPGKNLEAAVAADLAPRRPDLDLELSRAVTDFDQYRHLGVFGNFRKGYAPSSSDIEEFIRLADNLPTSPATTRLRNVLQQSRSRFEGRDYLVSQMLDNMPEESLLRVDVTVGQHRSEARPPLMHLGLSAKWSLRTDRAQDCISQGSKLATQRRGAMPHFAVITMEPRPSMLKILADGSGAIDCVYHLHLPALIEAVEVQRKKRTSAHGRPWSPGVTFDRLIRQRRLRDYDELVTAMDAIPTDGAPSATAQVVRCSEAGVNH